jgi:hypothetical protein
VLKEALFQIVLLLFTCGAALAAPQLNLEAATFSTDGSTVSFPLTLTNEAGVSLASVGTTLQFDQSKLGYSAIVPGPAATAAGKDAVANSPDPSTVIIGVTGFNTNIIANGVVATVTFTVKFAGGGTFVANTPSGADADGNEVVLSGTNGTVFVDSHLTVMLQGTGGGSVNSSPTGIHCTSGMCQADYYLGAPVTLTALPTGDTMVSWSNACAGCTGGTCKVNVTGSLWCEVTFSFVKPARIGTTDYDTLQAAYDAAADGATIMAREHLFSDALNCNLAKTATIKGGYNQTYTAQSGFSSIKGAVTIGKGGVIFDRVIVR